MRALGLETGRTVLVFKGPVLPMLFSKRIPETTVYRSAGDVQTCRFISLKTRAWIIHLLKSDDINQVVVIPRKELDSTID